MVEKPLILLVSIAVKGQATLVALEGPFFFSFVAYGSKYDSHFFSLWFYCYCLYEEHSWERDTLCGCVL